MRTSLAVAAAAALLATGVATAAPANAACAVGDTTCTGVTFTVAAGTISLVAQPTAAGGTATTSGSGASIDIPLGATTVNDTRIGSTGWSVAATASDFTTSGGTIGKAQAAFSVPVDATWTCTGTKTRKSAPTAVDGNGTTAALIGCSQAGASGATYIPVLTVTVPAGSIAGDYTGTVTQSVS